jgi:hypothetical protein
MYLYISVGLIHVLHLNLHQDCGSPLWPIPEGKGHGLARGTRPLEWLETLSDTEQIDLETVSD